MQEPLKLAIVGCGAVADLVHLPALAKTRVFEVGYFVDHNEALAIGAARQWPGSKACRSVDNIEGVQGALVCVPNGLHAEVACKLLQRGIHVLIEKPMASNIEQCKEILEAERGSNASVSVAMIWRHLSYIQNIKSVLTSGALGRLRHISISAGMTYEWPTKSGTMFNRQLSGGGVLLDFGSHMVDLMQDWLGELQVVSYRDDAVGNVEAECQVCFSSEACPNVELQLSRLRSLNNIIKIVGTSAELQLKTFGPEVMRLKLQTGQSFECKVQSDLEGAAKNQLTEFADVIQGRREPTVSARNATDTVKLIEECYAKPTALVHCWERPLD